MAEPLKTYFDEGLVRSLADDLVRAGLEPGAFVEEACAGLDALGLTARAEHVGRALERRLPRSPAAALRALVDTLGAPHATDELIGAGMGPFRYLPHSTVIARLGPLAPAEGLAACRELTRRFTAELCVRALLLAAPEATWAAVDAWVVDPDPHVRRLVSEGLRPRLPWAPRLRALQADPAPALARLERLVDDPSTLVRRSVANHLGDIAKDHPDLAVATARRWLAGDPARRPLVAHGLRHLLRQGHAGALAALDLTPATVAVPDLAVPRVVSLGDDAAVAFTVANTGSAPQRVRVDVAVRSPTARGGRRTRVFRAGVAELAVGAALARALVVRTRSFSTRTQHAGRWEVDVVVNGRVVTSAAFDVVTGAGALSG